MVNLIYKNPNSNYCIFSFDVWEDDKEFLPNLYSCGKNTLKYVYSCMQGSLAKGIDGSEYILSGNNEWILLKAPNNLYQTLDYVDISLLLENEA